MAGAAKAPAAPCGHLLFDNNQAASDITVATQEQIYEGKLLTSDEDLLGTMLKLNGAVPRCCWPDAVQSLLHAC